MKTPVLPDYTPKTTVEPAPWAGDGRYSQGKVFHPIVKGPDGRLAVDVYVDTDGKTMARLWRRADHPNLELLPSNAPRAVKALYRASGQLAYMRAEDYWGNPARAAFKAWDDYWAAKGQG